MKYHLELPINKARCKIDENEGKGVILNKNVYLFSKVFSIFGDCAKTLLWIYNYQHIVKYNIRIPWTTYLVT